MSAMPGLAAPIRDGGVGFDYRLSMGTPDLWIKYTKDKRRRLEHGELCVSLLVTAPRERTISYSEATTKRLWAIKR